MKTKILYISVILFSIMVYAQQGKVGINTVNPSADLDVRGNVKIKDGTEQAGRVLTSDSDGNASWAQPTMSYAYSRGGNPNNSMYYQGTALPLLGSLFSKKYEFTGLQVTLPTKGKYAVLLDLNLSITPNLNVTPLVTYPTGQEYSSSTNKLYENELIVVRGTFWDAILPGGIGPEAITAVPLQNKANSMFRGELTYPSNMARQSNTMFIENTTSGPKTFYFYALAQLYNVNSSAPSTPRYLYELGSSRWAEESLVVFKIGE